MIYDYERKNQNELMRISGKNFRIKENDETYELF